MEVRIKKGKMLKWLVADNDQVKRNQIIGRYLLDGKEHDLICQNDGRIKICAGDPVAIIECLHSVQVGGLCALCGADLTAHEKAATIAMVCYSKTDTRCQGCLCYHRRSSA